jgi:putative hemolysin
MYSETNLLTTAEAPLEVCLAESADDLRQAQRLRYEVFGVELGAHLPHATDGLDRDRFDARCDHLLVRERGGRVVGTYRMLPPQRAAAGDWYCADEFDCSRLVLHRAGIIEVGRACVAPEYRTGGVIALLWAGVMRYVQACGATHVIGCASLETHDGGHLAATICRRLLRDRLAPPQWRVTPKRAFVLEGWREIEDAPLPALIKGYLRLGAEVCGEPAWDPDFRTADLLVRLEVARANPRYVDRLLRAAA